VINGSQSNTNTFNGQTITYSLQFDYAARQNGVSSTFTSQANILWNNLVIASLVPTDYSVHHFQYNVNLQPGANVLQFDAASYSDSFGLEIANVQLTSAYNSTNLILNGNFANPNLGGAGHWNYFNGGILGWTAVKAEVGDCKSIYNSNWPANQQCIELDSDSNQRYTQTITISQAQFSQLLICISTQAGDANAANNLACETGQALQQAATAIATLEGGILCQINMVVGNFNSYICNLYQFTDAVVQNLHQDDTITISQYDYTTQTYTQQFGCSNEVDFDSSAFNTTNLQSW